MSENKIIAAIEFDHNDAKDMNTIADYIRDELASSFVKKNDMRYGKYHTI
ncbi:hypothetical protein OB902_04205 [Escherichia coli]|nr:hypothetical protein [Escherichia coli]